MGSLKASSACAAIILLTLPRGDGAVKASLVRSEFKLKADQYTYYLGMTQGSPAGIWTFSVEITNDGAAEAYVQPVGADFDNGGTEVLWRLREFYHTSQIVDGASYEGIPLPSTSREGLAPRVTAGPVVEMHPGETRTMTFFSEDGSGWKQVTTPTRNGYTFGGVRTDRKLVKLSFAVYTSSEIEDIIKQIKPSEKMKPDEAFKQYQWFSRQLAGLRERPTPLSINAK